MQRVTAASVAELDRRGVRLDGDRLPAASDATTCGYAGMRR